MSTRGEFGREGEALAGRYLEELGFKILDRSYRCPMGELDIVAMEGDTLVFVEVKARGSNAYGGPFAAVTRTKQRRLEKAALSYIKFKGLKPDSARFDVVGIVAGAVPELLRNAFTPARFTF